MKFKAAIPTSILFFILFSPLLMAQQKTGNISVDAEGFGISKKDALLKAKREAVEVGIGTMLFSQTEIKNYELQKDVILTQTAGSVKKYTILNEEKQQGNTYYVKINAIVSLDSIKADLAALKILLESMDKPRMMVVIKEEKGKNAENAIVDFLKSKEFEVVDPSVVASLMKKNTRLIQRAAAGEPAAAAKIGASNGAEYILVGSVTKSLGSSTLLESSGLKSGQANITAKLINCSNARIIASKSSRSAAAHISEDVAKSLAAKKVGNKLMDQELFEQIISSFQDMVNNGMPLDVIVNNVVSYKMQKAVRKKIRALPNVVSVNKRSFGNNRLKLTVLFKGNADTFSDMVDGKPFQGKSMSVTNIEGSRVVIRLN